MESILLKSQAIIDDPVFNNLVEKVTKILQLEILQEIQSNVSPKFYKLKAKSSRAGQAVISRVEKFPKEKKATIEMTFKSTNVIEKSLNDFAINKGIDLKSSKIVSKQLIMEKEFDFISKNFSKKYYVSFAERYMGIHFNGHGAVVNKNLLFKLHKVKCLDETNPEWPGSDTIAMGGVTLDDKMVESVISEFRVGSGFDDGDSKSYNPARVLKSFSFGSGGVFPKAYAVFLTIAEKDGGGFASFLAELYEAIKDKLGEVFAAVGGAIGAAVGGAIGGTLGGPIGILVGAAIGYILGKLVSWIIGIIQDDMFEPQVAMCEFGSIKATFNGSLQSPVQSLYFNNHGGRYQVHYNWEIKN